MAQTKKSDCFNDLRTRILTMDLAPGASVDEVSLCTHYGLSRTPLREILQRLAGAGYVTLQENRGAKIASMDLAVMRVFFQTAPMIYANTARLAAEHRSTEQLGAIKTIQAMFCKAEASEAALLNHRFHELIGEMAHNIYLGASLTRLLIDHTRLGQTFYRPASETERDLVRQARAHHDAMIDALEAQDSARMVELTLEHWALSKDQMERFVRPDPLPVDITAPKDHADAV